MATFCTKCGSPVNEGAAFCTNCGARREASSAPAAAQRFCTKCGAALAAETKFCTKCGAANVPQASAASAGASASAEGTSAAGSGETAGSPSRVASSAAPAHSGAGIPKIALIAGAAIVLVLVIAGVAGVVSAAHRAREKAQEMEASQKFAKSLENLASSAKSEAPRGNSPSAADISKSKNELGNVANAPTQASQNQGGAYRAGGYPPGGIPGEQKQGRGGRAGRYPPGGGYQPGRYPPGGIRGEWKPTLDPVIIARETAEADAALVPPPVPSGPPMNPVAATGNQAHDRALKYERTVGGPEADLVVRTGDINNLGFGWPPGFDPFSGQSTPPHSYPWKAPANEPPGTDRVLVGTGVMPVHMVIWHAAGRADQIVVDSIVKPAFGDGYSSSTGETCGSVRYWAFQGLQGTLGQTRLDREFANNGGVLSNLPDSIMEEVPSDEKAYLPDDFAVTPQDAAQCVRERQSTMPTPIVLPVGALPKKINNVLVQIFADDFQAPVWHSHFQVSLNGTRIPTFEDAINALKQTGPIGKLVTLRLLPEYWPLLKSGTAKLLIDDPTTHAPDGYAVDFVRILVNPHALKYQVSLTATVADADTHKPVAGATVTAGLKSAATDKAGKCELKGISAGLVVATANAPGYDENSVPVDLPAGQSGNAEIQLHRHQESTAALEQSIAQTGTATIYGIHFDTGSPKFRPDSLPALQAVLGLINGRPGSNWIIAGHTDNQGSDRINIPLSKARAASVISWLTAHGVAASRLDPQGFGSTRPVADNSTANGRFLNRRVEVSLAR